MKVVRVKARTLQAQGHQNYGYAQDLHRDVPVEKCRIVILCNVGSLDQDRWHLQRDVFEGARQIVGMMYDLEWVDEAELYAMSRPESLRSR